MVALRCVTFSLDCLSSRRLCADFRLASFTAVSRAIVTFASSSSCSLPVLKEWDIFCFNWSARSLATLLIVSPRQPPIARLS